jgi:hypothetical protein
LASAVRSRSHDEGLSGAWSLREPLGFAYTPEPPTCAASGRWSLSLIERQKMSFVRVAVEARMSACVMIWSNG